MKRLVVIAALILVATGVAVAQQSQSQSPPAQQHQHSMQGGGMCPMMSGGMMGAGQSDPRMMQMRGEMMKAMGDIMMKYGKMVEGSGR